MHFYFEYQVRGAPALAQVMHATNPFNVRDKFTKHTRQIPNMYATNPLNTRDKSSQMYAKNLQNVRNKSIK